MSEHTPEPLRLALAAYQHGVTTNIQGDLHASFLHLNAALEWVTISDAPLLYQAIACELARVCTELAQVDMTMIAPAARWSHIAMRDL